MITYEQNLKELKVIKDSVVMEQDPVSQGLNYFTNMFQKIQASKDRVLSMVIDAVWNKSVIAGELSSLKEQYSQAFAGVMVREDVITLKSQDLRSAVADNELAAINTKIAMKEREMIMGDAYYRNCILVYEELKSKNDNIEQQLITVRAMMSVDVSLRDALAMPVQISHKEV
jgi:hypothetical protein